MSDTSSRSRLEDEREFLLRSIEDLHDQRRAGDIDPVRFEELLATYTARAASTLRDLKQVEAADETGVVAAPGRAGRWAAPVAVVALVAVGAAVFLPGAISDRAPGQTITGNSELAPPPPTTEQAVALAARRPDDPEAQLGAARALLQQGQLVDALKAFDATAALEPRWPEPHAYGGWIVFLAGLPDRALTRLDRAVEADPSYPDAHFFRAMALRALEREAEAVPEFESYLRLTPTEDPLRPQVEALLAELSAQSGGG